MMSEIEIEGLIRTLTIEEDLTSEQAEFLRGLPREALELVRDEVLFVGTHHAHGWPARWQASGINPCDSGEHWPILCVNVNDTFCYACGDAEEVPKASLPEIAQIYRQHGGVGLICWAAKRRDLDPVVEYTEDPVYQATWKALYGEAKVEPSPFANERWSDEKLNLRPWTPEGDEP